jgi:hypothetical protein
MGAKQAEHQAILVHQHGNVIEEIGDGEPQSALLDGAEFFVIASEC